jgi:hypothetical protein
MYAAKHLLGRKLTEKEGGYEADKDIYDGGLPRDLQWLWSNYDPVPGVTGYPIDFTWEREWRVKQRPQLPALPIYNSGNYLPRPATVIIVEKDADIPVIEQEMRETNLARKRVWPKYLNKVISLETAGRQLSGNPVDSRYGRIETWPGLAG